MVQHQQQSVRALLGAQGASAGGVEEGLVVGAAAAAATTSYPPVFANGSKLVGGIDLASSAGIQQLEVR